MDFGQSKIFEIKKLVAEYDVCKSEGVLGLNLLRTSLAKAILKVLNDIEIEELNAWAEVHKNDKVPF